jgi:D-psicose/D-tagatose/L-ribulose 3-epimerase
MCIRALVTIALLLGFAPTAGHSQVRRVAVGLCTPLAGIEAAKGAGFDYAELATTEIAGLSDADFELAVSRIKQAGIATPAANLFLPAALKVTGPAIDREAQNAYLAKAFDRLARLGVEIVVFGSGGARRVPDGFPQDEAFKQLVEFGQRVAPAAQRRRITVVVEPLRKQETNIINSAAEGLTLVQAINEPAFQLMIDFFHLASEHEDPAVVLRAAAHLRHLHMANPNGRVYPLEWSEFDYAPFFANLRQAGYGQRISVEASAKNFEAEAPRAIALVRGAFER